MKKKYKSKSAEQLIRKIFGKDVEEAKPDLCPECGKELLFTSIACGFECCFEYLCLKCSREIVIGSKSGMICNKKLSQNKLIKKMVRNEKLSRKDIEKLTKGLEDYQKNSLE